MVLAIWAEALQERKQLNQYSFHITGVLVGGTVVGMTVTVVGPSVAAWVMAAAANVSITIATVVDGATEIIYKVGQAIEKIVSPPLIPSFAK